MVASKYRLESGDLSDSGGGLGTLTKAMHRPRVILATPLFLQYLWCAQSSHARRGHYGPPHTNEFSRIAFRCVTMC